MPHWMRSGTPSWNCCVDSRQLMTWRRQETLTLRFVDGMSLAEIAQALGFPAGTVKSRLHGSIATLRASPSLKEFFD